MSLDASDPRFTPEEHLGNDLADLAIGWAELGIDPDDFVRCSGCGGYIAGEEPPLCTCE